jgi:hypothetical protein
MSGLTHNVITINSYRFKRKISRASNRRSLHSHASSHACRQQLNLTRSVAAAIQKRKLEIFRLLINSVTTQSVVFQTLRSH